MSCFDIFVMNYTVYTINCNSATHGTYPLTLATYKYSELQISSPIQKLGCKASYNTPFFLIMIIQNYLYVFGLQVHIP
jgi:hypothetical protein